MKIELTPEQERIVKSALKHGRFRTAEEVVGMALDRLKQQERLPTPERVDEVNAHQDRAVRQMLEFVDRNHVRLDGVSVKDLIREGRRV